jgi:glyoxylase I family protein
MTDGSCIAFFDLGDDVAAEKSPNTPEWVNHIALRVESVEELARLKARLEAHGVEVLGVTDHHIFQSIYFFDPNGIRLELTAQLASEMQMQEESRRLARVSTNGRSGKANGGVSAPQALIADACCCCRRRINRRRAWSEARRHRP